MNVGKVFKKGIVKSAQHRGACTLILLSDLEVCNSGVGLDEVYYHIPMKMRYYYHRYM